MEALRLVDGLFARWNCTHVYLDVGSNIGVQVHKLYEPSKFLGAPVLKEFERYFGAADTVDRCRTCTVGFEPNPRHTDRLVQLEANLTRAGAPVLILHAAASVQAGEISFMVPAAGAASNTASEDWGAHVDRPGASEQFTFRTGRTEAYERVTVPTLDLNQIIHRINHHLARGKPSGRGLDSKIVMKMDIEGAEDVVLPHLLAGFSLCLVDRLFIEFHAVQLHPKELASRATALETGGFDSRTRIGDFATAIEETMVRVLERKGDDCRTSVSLMDDETFVHGAKSRVADSVCSAAVAPPPPHPTAATSTPPTIWGNFSWLSERLNDPKLRSEVTSRVPGRGIHHALKAWVINKQAPPGALPRPAPDINCSDPRYQGALSGRPRQEGSGLTIVDFVPVGNDLDVLEIRLLESWSVVDVFVLHESAWTLSGLSKPLYLNESMATTSRWTPFERKILYLPADEADMLPHVQLVHGNLDAKRPFKDWHIEKAMRALPVAMVKRSRHPLARFINSAAATGALALQNDGDEIPSAAALAHLKHCEAREQPPYMMPATQYKGHLWHSVRHTDMDWIGERWRRMGLDVPDTYSHHLWRSGPTVSSLQAMLDGGSSLATGDPESKAFRGTPTPRWPDFGPGAAIHLSSPADPIQILLKGFSTSDGAWTHNSVFPEALGQALSQGMVTPALINSNLHNKGEDWCARAEVARFTDEHQRRLREELPWALRDFPSQYPCVTLRSTGGCTPPICF